jgi:hypothetical protein
MFLLVLGGITIFVLNLVLDLLRFVFSFCLGKCYLLVLQLFSSYFFRSVYIFTLFDEQRHLVRYFRGILVPPAEYSNFVCILSWYLLVSRFSLAYCRAICFFALVEILIREYLF